MDRWTLLAVMIGTAWGILGGLWLLHQVQDASDYERESLARMLVRFAACGPLVWLLVAAATLVWGYGRAQHAVRHWARQRGLR